MRKLSAASATIIIGVALYFTLAWGYDGVRVLTSPSYGLDEVWRSQFIFGIGSIFGLSPIGLIKLAAFFGAVKLAVAAVCAAHILDRLRVLIGGKPDNDILEGGLILVVLISIASVGPAVWAHNAGLVRETTSNWCLPPSPPRFACSSVVQRSPKAAKPAVATELAATPRGAPWFSPFR